jgi:serine/threonine protein kinase
MTDDSCSFLVDPTISGYMKSVVQKSISSAEQSIPELFNKTNPELLDLLMRMLTFNPYLRPAAKDLLKSPIFEGIRSTELERPSPFKIHLSADSGDNMQNYEKQNEVEVIDFTSGKIPERILYLRTQILK